MSKASIKKEKTAPYSPNKARENPGFANALLLSEFPLEKIQCRANDTFSWMSGNAAINNRISFNGILPGKQAVIQPKPDISHPEDDYEKEANSVANKVMRMTEPQAEDKSLSFPARLTGKPLAASISPLIQTSTCGVSTETASLSRLGSRLNNSKNNGSQLPCEARSFMENRFGTGFGHVKIHTDANAIQMNKDLNAQAFTHGSDIYFNSGKFDTESFSGKHLLAHELTHVVQQNGLSPVNNIATAIQREGNEDDDWYSFDFEYLPPEMKLRLWRIVLDAKLTSSELSYIYDKAKVTGGYSYGSDVYLGGTFGDFSSRAGFDPSTYKTSLDFGYDKFKIGGTFEPSSYKSSVKFGYDQYGLSTSFDPSTRSFGFGFNYGVPLLPMPWDLSAKVYQGAGGLEDAITTFGTPSNPFTWYGEHKESVSDVIGAVKSLMPLSDVKSGDIGAGLQFSYNKTSGILICAGVQLVY